MRAARPARTGRTASPMPRPMGSSPWALMERAVRPALQASWHERGWRLSSSRRWWHSRPRLRCLRGPRPAQHPHPATRSSRMPACARSMHCKRARHRIDPRARRDLRAVQVRTTTRAFVVTRARRGRPIFSSKRGDATRPSRASPTGATPRRVRSPRLRRRVSPRHRSPFLPSRSGRQAPPRCLVRCRRRPSCRCRRRPVRDPSSSRRATRAAAGRTTARG